MRNHYASTLLAAVIVASPGGRLGVLPLPAATMELPAAAPVRSSLSVSDPTCFTCQIAPVTCGGDYHLNWVDQDESDIWQENYHGLTCFSGNCSSHHSWYYNCGEGNEECGGGLCYPHGLPSADDGELTERGEAELVLLAANKPHRFYADLERNLVLGLACNGSVAATFKVRPSLARRIAELAHPELLHLF